MSKASQSTNWRSKVSPPPSIDHQAPPKSSSRWRPNHDHDKATARYNKSVPGARIANGQNTKSEDDAQTQTAIAEGRRLYVGNMPYLAKGQDVSATFSAAGFEIASLNISIDPFTGRNPSYCFVEMRTKDEAERAMAELNGTPFMGRPLKVGPGLASSRSGRSNAVSTSRRGGRSGGAGGGGPFDRWARIDAAAHWKEPADEGRRVWVGGLPRMDTHHDVETEVREFFTGFSVETVSKVIIPPFEEDAPRDKPIPNIRYLFVDFPAKEIAQWAAEAKNRTMGFGVEVKVRMARPGGSKKVDERQKYEEEVGGESEGEN